MANAPYLQGSGAVPEAIALALRGIQTDQYGEILGGHKALFDFMQSGVTGKPTAGYEFDNLVVDGDTAEVEFSFATAANVEDVKGLNFSVTADGSHERVLLPEVFDLLTLGSEPSVVISAWITHTAPPASGAASAFGHAYQNSTYSQYHLECKPDGTINVKVNGYGSGGITFTPPTGTPFLFTLHINRTGSGTFEWSLYIGGTKTGVTQTSGATYPFQNPDDQGSEWPPVLGTLGGFGGHWQGTVHRLQLIKVPQDFNVSAWITEELANNDGRFDVA